MYEIKLYFGMTKGTDKEIMNEDFMDFVDECITSRFPDGLTIINGYGQWLNKDGRIIREKCKVLILIVELWDDITQGNVYDIRNEYCEQFQQESVIIVVNGLMEMSF